MLQRNETIRQLRVHREDQEFGILADIPGENQKTLKWNASLQALWRLRHLTFLNYFIYLFWTEMLVDMKQERGPHLPLFSISQDLTPHHTAAEEAQHLYFLMGKFGFLIKQLPELLTPTPAEATGDLPAFPPRTTATPAQTGHICT